MKSQMSLEELIKLFACPNHDFDSEFEILDQSIQCSACGCEFPTQVDSEIPKIFTIPIEFDSGLYEGFQIKFDKSKWTPWRKEIYSFIMSNLSLKEEVVVDIGAGPGVFNELMPSSRIISIDFTNFPQINLVADITRRIPLKRSIANLVLLLNTLEHVYDPLKVFESASSILKDDGLLMLAVPFLLGVHQAPHDYFRYTPYSLEKLSSQAGLELKLLLPVSDLITFETLSRHYFQYQIPRSSQLIRFIWQFQKGLHFCLRLVKGKGIMRKDYTVGYLALFAKKAENGVQG